VNLEAQIELITVPQEFTRLCNAVLSAEYGADFLPIDDDRADSGNDGYRKSAKQVFAVHCFKRIQKQKISEEIRRKMLGDLGKAKTLKEQGLWEVDAWTFVSNYAMPEEIGREAVALGAKSGIDVSWLGPNFLASALQRHGDLRELFPSLQVNEIVEQLEDIREALDDSEPQAPDRVPRTPQEQQALLAVRPPGWEYLLFASTLYLSKQELEFKWRDHEVPPYVPRVSLGSISEATDYLVSEFNQVLGLTEALMRVFPEEVQEEAFGAPGEAGDPVRIQHFATRIMQTYSELLDWAASLRAVDPPEILAPSFEMAARMADQPLREVREFVDTAVREFDRIPAFVARHTEGDVPLEIQLELKITMDEEVSAEFHRRLKRAKRKLRWGF
jgi:hypothetical protein